MKENEAFNWIDVYSNTKSRTILTQKELQVPGLEMIGHYSRFQATESLPLHYHKDSFEITYIVSGYITFSVDGKDYKLSGGDVFITKPNQIHSTNTAPINASEIYWCQLRTKSKQSLLNLNPEASAFLTEKLLSIQHPHISTKAKEMQPLLKSAFDLFVQVKNQQLATQYLSLFLHKLIESSEDALFKLTPDIGRAVDYILNNVEDKITLEELAIVSFLSISQFKQKFKNQIGISPRHFINLQKIDYSKHLLLERKNVTEVAFELNFESTSYFTVVFKKFNSCTPKQYINDNT